MKRKERLAKKRAKMADARAERAMRRRNLNGLGFWELMSRQYGAAWSRAVPPSAFMPGGRFAHWFGHPKAVGEEGG